jgi:hypothetical protein
MFLLKNASLSYISPSVAFKDLVIISLKKQPPLTYRVSTRPNTPRRTDRLQKRINETLVNVSLKWIKNSWSPYQNPRVQKNWLSKKKNKNKRKFR